MIRVVVDDLAFVNADALVRPATGALEPTSPALRRLEQVGGPAFYNQLHVTQDLDVGAAVVTAGGDLAAEFVIHAIITTRHDPVSSAGVRRALTSALQRAVDWQLAHLAIPPLGTGAGNLELDDVARLTVDVLTTHMQHVAFPSEVSIVVENEADRDVFDAHVRRGGA